MLIFYAANFYGQFCIYVCLFVFLISTIKKNGGTCPLTYQRCLTVLSKMGPVAKPVETVTAAHIGST